MVVFNKNLKFTKISMTIGNFLIAHQYQVGYLDVSDTTFGQRYCHKGIVGRPLTATENARPVDLRERSYMALFHEKSSSEGYTVVWYLTIPYLNKKSPKYPHMTPFLLRVR